MTTAAILRHYSTESTQKTILYLFLCLRILRIYYNCLILGVLLCVLKRAYGRYGSDLAHRGYNHIDKFNFLIDY
jgi:hypothetical protein